MATKRSMGMRAIEPRVLRRKNELYFQIKGANIVVFNSSSIKSNVSQPASVSNVSKEVGQAHAHEVTSKTFSQHTPAHPRRCGYLHRKATITQAFTSWHAVEPCRPLPATAFWTLRTL